MTKLIAAAFASALTISAQAMPLAPPHGPKRCMANRGRAGSRPSQKAKFLSLHRSRALIGKTKGASVEVEAPSGAKFYKIEQIEWLE
jgi:hypothetical protein